MHTDLYLLIAHGSHGSHGSCSRRGAHGFWTLEFSEHEIRRRPTDRREVIKRIARIVFARGSYSVFNTHTDFTLFFICTRISRISRIFVRGGALTGGLNTRFFEHEFLSKRISFAHGSRSVLYAHGSRSFALSLRVKDCLSALLHFIGFLYIATWKHNSVVLIPIFQNTSL